MMEESIDTSLDRLDLCNRSVEIASCINKDTNPTHDEDDNICDDCSNIPWELFGASEDPTSYTAREPFMSWKYVVPEGHLWPGSLACRVCRFVRELLTDYGFGNTSSVRKLRGGWDGEKPFRMTFLELEGYEHDSVESGHAEDEHDTLRSEDDREVQSDGSGNENYNHDCEDGTYTIWEDDDDAYHTFSIPSFFATALEVGAFQSAMQGYKPTNANLSIIKSWLDECDSTHDKTCHPWNLQYVRNLKVIDCAKRAIVPAPPNCAFVALSYVWGPPSAQPNISSSDITIALPRTIEDSMTVTQELGFTYLWIDRYCINQHDEQEKEEQIAQMADIYASAAVTIIAVAGEDPGHGLPGIQSNSRGLHRYEKVRSTHLFANPPIEPRDRYSPYYVHESKWASRAWTFQECYNSPRRLFFTTEQITLICNSAAYQETAGTVPLPSSHPIHTNLRGWLNTFNEGSVSMAVLDAVPYLLAGIMDTLMVYSQRRMSYDSDALNAIVGTLNTFARHSIQHLWGVPIWLPTNAANMEQSTVPTPSKSSLKRANTQLVLETSNDNGSTHSYRREKRASQSESSIALLWHNHSPCYRRTGFPSWSPLGWKEGADWAFKQGIGWFSRQTPSASGGDFLTLLASCHGVKMLPHFQPIAAYRFEDTDYNSTGAVPQQIIVEARTVTLCLALSPDGVTSDRYRHSVGVRFDDSLEIVMAASWDEAPLEMDVETSLKGLLIAVANSSACCSDSPHYAVIIVKQQKDHWERVAIALITNNYIKSRTREVGPVCDFATAHPPLFRQTSTGALFTWDLHNFNQRSTEVLDISHLEFEHDEPWWRRCSLEETIALG